MALTPQQVQQLRSQYNLDKPAAPVKAAPSIPGGPGDLQKRLAGIDASAKGGLTSKATIPQSKPAQKSTLSKFFSDAPKNIVSAAKGGLNQVKEGVEGAAQSKNPLQLFENSAKIGAGIVNTVTSPLAPVTKPISQAVDYAGDKISDIPAVQKFANSKAGEITSRAAEDVSNTDTIAGAVVGYGEAPDAVAAVTDTAGKVVSKAGEAVDNVKANLTEKYVNQAAKEWEKPTTIPKASYNKATDVLQNAAGKGNDVPKTLVKNGVRLQDNVTKTETGRLVYETADTAEKIRADAGQISKEAVRPALQAADKAGFPKTQVSDVLSKTIKDIEKSRNVTPGDIESQIAKAKTEANALAKKYPDGMTLEDMHNEKINYASNGKYSPVGDTNVNNVAGVNRAFGRTLGKNVEDGVPEVGDLNKALTKQYQAADYLDALHGKSVPRSFTQRIANLAGKGVGAALGVPGGLFGEVVGYHLGGMVENVLSSLPNPIKNWALDNMKIENPEAFAKLQDLATNPKNPNVAAPADIPTRAPLPENIKVNNYQNPEYPRYLTKDLINRAARKSTKAPAPGGRFIKDEQGRFSGSLPRKK